MRKIDRVAIKRERERIKRRNMLTAVVVLLLIGFCVNSNQIIGLFFNTVDQLSNNLQSNSYQNIYYYEKENLERYQIYHGTHESLAPEDIVWRVNMELDKPFYTLLEKNDVAQRASTLLVNKYHPLPKTYVPENLTILAGEHYVAADAYQAYERMRQDMAKLGLSIKAITAYRSYDYQEQMYHSMLANGEQESVDAQIARPGYSEHQTGRAIDIGATNGSKRFQETEEAGWIETHGHQYGFIIRYPKDQEQITGYIHEPWHVTYVGVDIATMMKENGIATLEEYVAKYIDHQPK